MSSTSASETAVRVDRASAAGRRTWPTVLVIAVLCMIAGGTMIARHPSLPSAAFLERYVSPQSLPESTAVYAEEALLVPWAAFLVVVIRLVLGVRMMGPFRPILVALAFAFTGFIVGTLFMAATLAIVALLRPRLKQDWLPYASRLPLLLIVVIILQVTLVLLSAAMDWPSVGRAMFFPIVVLCLTADGFARILSDEGRAAAVWRGTTTVLAATVIYGSYHVPLVEAILVEYPELMFAEIAGILFVSRFCAVRWLEGFGPKAGSEKETG